MSTDLKANQIWKDCDPRKVRYVRITLAGGGTEVQIETCDAEGKRVHGARRAWAKRVHGARRAWAKRDRFNGKSGGYSFVKDSAP